ncbi:hypothetical protein RND81_14G100600 [Saponaria officinalis]|uniref:RING-type E3 ubiquitin transferase n=1 Tax=Saponaria officinalis TaxID=3572 RepID=A0AAW1GUJ2_SAPOF
MNSYTKIIIILPQLLIIFLYSPTSTGLETCDPSNCPKSSTKSMYSIDVSVQYPFHLRDVQAGSCGMTGFDLYCDYTFGTLIRLPNNTVLRVEGIYYNSNQIILSDPYNQCIPHKLMSLNLSNTPFNLDGITKNFWVYNCSSDRNFEEYDQIDCLSGSGYTVISSGSDIMEKIGDLNCKFLKILNVPVSYPSSLLSYVPTISLNWNGDAIPPPPGKYSNSGFNSVYSKFSLVLAVFIFLMTVIFGFRYLMYGRVRSISPINANTTSTDETEVGGLDQVTIDSYPQLVVGDSGRLIKPDDNICPICLSDYRPRDTLKLLPECLHRFHAECIDQWLRSKGICPICRTSPPHIS